MPTADESPARVLRDLERVRSQVVVGQRRLLARWQANASLGRYADRAANLAAYIALRRLDLTRLQPRLAELGLSSLGRCEAHVMPTLHAVLDALRRMCGREPSETGTAPAGSIARSAASLKHAADRLLGPEPRDRRTRFMVTLPLDAATDADFVDSLVGHGMDCARINAAHDTPDDWIKMAKHVRLAAARRGRNVRILVDLPGPKLRTGPLPPGEPVLRMKVKRDERGGLIAAAPVILDGSGRPGRDAIGVPGQATEPPRLSVPSDWVRSLRPSDEIVFSDLRGRARRFTIVRRIDRDQVVAACERGAYVAPGTRLERRSRAGAREPAVVGAFDAPPVAIRVRAGDRLLLSPVADAGRPPRRDAAGRVRAPARIGCIEPSVFRHLRPGHGVKIDDGKVEAVVDEVGRNGAMLRILRAPPRGARLGPDKGLNFPDTPLPPQALDARDQTALRFAAEHADLVGYSFVQSGAEMANLHQRLGALTRRKLGVIAKIETSVAIRNLPDIIVRGASHGPFGVMIARGDLAVEIGYLRLAEVQEELMWLCEAARVPVIWATQVLEGLIKRGAPTRAEMTDAASAERAECIMLNKGPYLAQALDLLGSLVGRMARHQSKKTARFPPLPW